MNDAAFLRNNGPERNEADMCPYCGSKTTWVKHFYGDENHPRGRNVCITFGSNCKWVQEDRQRLRDIEAAIDPKREWVVFHIERGALAG